MKYIDEFRDKDLVEQLAAEMQKYRHRDYHFMEVCGGHTMAIFRFGIKSLLPENFHLISGPGCPVCVTSKAYIDKAIAYSRFKNIILTSYGDLMRVPGSYTSLEKEKAFGSDIRIVYSALNAVEIAKSNPEKKIVFLAIGFETTAPGTAVAIKECVKSKIKNFHIFSAHKIMPPAMKSVIQNGTNIDGFICPGHVCAVTGSKIFNFIPSEFAIPCVVSGFEPTDLLQTLIMLVNQIEDNTPRVEIQYRRVVSRDGNLIAQKYIKDVFNFSNDWWRGFGIIEKSGLKLRDEFSAFDIEKTMPLSFPEQTEDRLCICGEILKGQKTPADCALFSKKCTPENPVGACMVTGEGTCNVYYKYNRHG